AASIGSLEAIAPSFVAAIEARIAASRASESYEVFKALCGRERIYVGLKKGETFRSMGAASGAEGTGAPGALGETGFDGLMSDCSEAPEESASEAYLIWLIAPSPTGGACAVEFAGGASESAATFVYRFDGSFEFFVGQLNRALEAIDFRREVIRLNEEELLKPANLSYLMAIQRNAALQFVRKSFSERLIHRSLEGWKESLRKAFA
ncbi:MAG: hypothetical protein FWE65_03940, partial [Eggerthellaceae bacterium]|nr:hypothetical protein [Eggerthellaceae bacterium]